jgi:predicted  nucleic acid-binding Zn-ribbon protein
MVSSATLLYRLQTLDLAITQRRARIQEIDALLSGDERVLRAQGALEEAEMTLKPLQTRSRDLDLEIKSVAQKIKLTDENLYSGKIKNPKEMSEMQEEIASLQRHQSQLEDELLEMMMRADDGQVLVASAKKALAEAKAAQTSDQSHLTGERGQLEDELAGLEAQRIEGASAIDADSLRAYEALRPRKGGHPVALLQGDSCTACNVEQTSIVTQQVWQGHSLVYCAICGRILAATP